MHLLTFGKANSATTLAGLDFAISLASLEIPVSLAFLDNFLTSDSALAHPLKEKLLLLRELHECRMYLLRLSESETSPKEGASEGAYDKETALLGESISAKEYRALVLESTATGHF